MPILLFVKVCNFAVSQYWARAQNALFVRKIVENHILFVLKMPILVPSSHFLTTFCTKACSWQLHEKKLIAFHTSVKHSIGKRTINFAPVSVTWLI